MNYEKAIYFKDGKCLTITRGEADGIISGLQSGGRWIDVQGELISADTIARVGTHHATAHIKKMAEADSERIMKIEGKGDVVELKKEEEKGIAIETTLGEKRGLVGDEYKEYINKISEPEERPQTSEEVANGDVGIT